MNRIGVMRLICVAFLLILTAGAKDKDSKGDKKDRAKTEVKKISGTVIKHERGITKMFKILGDKSYSISRSAQGKVMQYEGEIVTLYATVMKDRIVKISGVLKGASENVKN
jgi:hypothetical protein